MRTELKRSMVAGLIFGLFFGVYTAVLWGIEYVVFTAPFTALFFGGGMFFFMTSGFVRKATHVDTPKDQDLIHSDSANHYKKSEAVGGKLYIFSGKLHFKSHPVNLQNHELELSIDEIEEVSFYNVPIIPLRTGLRLILRNRVTHKFIVYNRIKWKQLIENQIMDI